MTPNGAFIINGTERVIVNQLHRSPGVFDAQRSSKDLSSTGKTSFTARIVPQDGRWLDFEFDSKDILFVRIDRKKKFHSTLLMLALGEEIDSILKKFLSTRENHLQWQGFTKDINFDLLPYQRATYDIKDSKGNIIIRENRRFNTRIIEKIQELGMTSLEVPEDELIGSYLVKRIDGTYDKDDPIDSRITEEITEETVEYIKDNNYNNFEIYFVDNNFFSSSLVLTINEMISKTKVLTKDQAVSEIYKKFRPTDPPTPKVATTFFENMFFSEDTYRLSKVGRMKINYKLNHGVANSKLCLDPRDILESFKYLLLLKSGRGEVDDIDHLGNRRVRTVGELIEDRFFVGLERLSKSIKEKINV